MWNGPKAFVDEIFYETPENSRKLWKTMKTFIKILLIAVILCVGVKSVPQGTKVENVEKPDEMMIGHDDETILPNLNKGFITFKKIREEFPELVKNISVHGSRIPPGNPSSGLGIGTLFNTLLGGVHSLYQDLLNRQQAFINLLTCGNCVNEGWDAIVDVALTVPELEWVYKPSDKSPTTFFTAVHQNGTVTGIGGSVVNGRPIAEYAFGNDGIKRYLTEKHKIKSSR